MPNEDPTPGHSPPSPHQQTNWPKTVYLRSNGSVSLAQSQIDGVDAVKVIPAAAADRLAEALEKIATDDVPELTEPEEWPYSPDERAWKEMQAFARSALSEYHSQKETGRG